MEEITSVKPNVPQERLDVLCDKKSRELTTAKCLCYYFAVVLLDIAILGLFWVWIGNIYGVEKFSTVFETLDFQYIYFMLAIVVSIVIFSALLDFGLARTNVRFRRFGGVLVGSIYKQFFNDSTCFRGGHYVQQNVLKNSHLEPKYAVDSVYQNKISADIALLVYSFIFLIVGTIVCLEREFIWLLICAFVIFLIKFSYLLFIVFFEKNKEKSINFVGKVAKFLYKLKIIKDIDIFYSNTVSKYIEYSSILKNKKVSNIFAVLTHMFLLFARHFLLFATLQFLNFAEFNVLIEILFKMSIIELFVSIMPLPKGIAIFELLFILLFRNVFFDGFVLWGMVIYRIIDYYIYSLIFLITWFIPKRCDSSFKKKTL